MKVDKLLRNKSVNITKHLFVIMLVYSSVIQVALMNAWLWVVVIGFVSFPIVVIADFICFSEFYGFRVKKEHTKPIGAQEEADVSRANRLMENSDVSVISMDD